MKLSHIALRVEDIETAIEQWTKFGFMLEKRFEKTDPDALAAWLRDKAGGCIELWQYADSDDPKAARRGRHVAFLCDDLRSDAAALLAAGFREVAPYTEGKLVNYMFLEDKYGMAFELTEEKIGVDNE